MKTPFHIKRDLYSKLIDGLFTSLVLVLIGLLMAQIIPVVQVVWGRPGLMVYTLIILALSVIMLERSIANRYDDESQARFGLIGGLLTWGVIDQSNLISIHGASSEMGIIIFIMIILVSAVLWRRSPGGVRFYMGTVITRWGGYLALAGFRFLDQTYPQAAKINDYAGYVAAGLAAASLLWILLRSRTSTHRLWAALFLFESLVIVNAIFRSAVL